MFIAACSNAQGQIVGMFVTAIPICSNAQGQIVANYL